LLFLGFALSAVPLVQADVIHTRSARFEGRVLRVVKENVVIKTGDAELTIPLRDVVRDEIPAPAEYKEGVTAIRNHDFAGAAAKFRPIAERLGGLRSPWIADAMLRLADAYVELKDYENAKRIYTEYQGFYVKSPEAIALMDIKFAHIEAGQKKFAEAVAKASPAIEALLKRNYLSVQEETLLSEGLVLVGDCQLAEGKKEPALESYLKVVALYDVDPGQTLEALYKAGKVFEDLGNWRRARDCYRDLLADSPSVTFAADAKKRLDAITQANPE
jgi:TolA-binding protein